MTRPSIDWWCLTITVVAAFHLAEAASAQNESPPLKGAGSDLFGDPLPVGARTRLGTTRFRHGSQWLRGLALTPDGASIIAAAEDGSLSFYDTVTGTLSREVKLDPLNIRGFAMSPTGRDIAVAGFWYSDDRRQLHREVRIIDAFGGKESRMLARTDPSVDDHAMAFTPDGKLLVSLGTSGVLRIEEVESGIELLQQRFDRDNSPSLALSPDGKTIAVSTGANTEKFFLWKWQSSEAPQELKISGKQGSYGELAFSPDGKLLAACLNHNARPLQIWEVETGRLLHRLVLPDPKTHIRGTVLFSPDGTSVAASGWRNDDSRSVAIHLWNPKSGEYRGQLDVRAGGLLAMSANGQYLASSSGAGLRVWRWSSQEEVSPVPAAHRDYVNRVVSTPRGQIITASDDGSIRVWDGATSRQLHELRHESWVRDIAVSPDGRNLASSALDDTVRLWNLETGQETYQLPGHGRRGGTRAVGFSADGERFGSFGDDCYLRMWDVRSGKALVEHKVRPTGVKIPEVDGERDALDFFHIDRATFSQDASILAFSIGKHFVFQSETGRELHQIENPGSHVSALAISPGNRYLLASGWGKPQQIKMADGRMHHTTEKNNPITIWDLSTAQVVKQILLADGGAGPVAFSADGERFAVSTMRPTNKIVIYTTATGDELQSIDSVPTRAWSVCFSHDGKSIIAGLADTTAVVWDLSALPMSR